MELKNELITKDRYGSYFIVVILYLVGITKGIINSQLVYAYIRYQLYKTTVKLHGVSPSRYENSASARKIQIRWIGTWDSRKVVTPFMRVNN